MTLKLLTLGLLISIAGSSAWLADASERRGPAGIIIQPQLAPDGYRNLGIEHVERQIGMFYKLDLAQDNRHAQSMVQVMRYFDDRLRSCYTDRLEEQPDLQGLLIVRFKLSKDTGMMRKIKRAGGNLSDTKVFRCLKRQLARMPFDPPRDLDGTLYYRFGIFDRRTSFKSERAASPRMDEFEFEKL